MTKKTIMIQTLNLDEKNFYFAQNNIVLLPMPLCNFDEKRTFINAGFFFKRVENGFLVQGSGFTLPQGMTEIDLLARIPELAKEKNIHMIEKESLIFEKESRIEETAQLDEAELDELTIVFVTLALIICVTLALIMREFFVFQAYKYF